ncbi:MAG: SGNH/GDSL hydrolase family protein [Saprospiraceae bacterium]|nr:SGNH/GDSL hydrolase family protein [Saprospiraceae bacterium]
MEGQSIATNPDEEINSKTIRFLALGDSYTIGQGVAEELRWPNQLAKLLESYEYKLLETNIIARTGWTTGNLISAIESQSPDPHELVSLLIGVNNQYQGQSFEVYQTELVTLIDKAIKLAGSKERVFMVSIPDYGVTPFGQSNSENIAKELDAYNAFAKEKCDALDIPFINITEISRSLGSSEGALASDQLHPSGQQYTLWVDAILSEVLDMLEK